MFHTRNLGAKPNPGGLLRATRAAAGLALIFIAVSVGATLRHYATGAVPQSPGFLPILAFGVAPGAPIAAVLLWLGRPLS